jgi:hypothetical protein
LSRIVNDALHARIPRSSQSTICRPAFVVTANADPQ